MMGARYSIIIPHHNVTDLLRRGLASIPHREDVQIIVVDDHSSEQALTELRDPVIVHFAGCKPWDRSRINQGHPFASTFFKYQSQTKWKGVKTDERPYKLRVINYVADMLRKYGLKSPLPHSEHEFFDIAPID